MRRVSIPVNTSPGTAREPVFNILPPPLYVMADKPQRVEFSTHSERVSIEGTCETVQDLRDTLREMLALLEDM